MRFLEERKRGKGGRGEEKEKNKKNTLPVEEGAQKKNGKVEVENPRPKGGPS